MNSGGSAAPLTELLARAVGAGDAAARDRAFAEISRLLTVLVRARMGSRLRGRRESVDVCQSVAKSMVDDLNAGRLSFHSDAALMAYLQQVVKTKLAELARHDGAKRREGERHESSIAAESGLGQGLEAHAPDWTASIKASHAEQYALFLAKLDEPDRRLLELRGRGLEWEQVATELGVEAGVARKRFSRLQQRALAALSSGSRSM